MAVREYEKISRRGLIKLNHDFDKENNDALKKYLEEHPDYEGVRMIERATEKVDTFSEKVTSKTGQIADTIIEKVDDIFDAVIDTMSNQVKAGASSAVNEAAKVVLKKK